MNAEEVVEVRARAARGEYDPLPRVEYNAWADNVLVLMDHHADPRSERVTAGGILVPRSADKPADDATVQAIVLDAAAGYWVDKHNQADRRAKTVREQRELKKWQTSEVKRGDRVLVDRADQGDVYELPDGREARIVRAHNIVGVLEEESAAE